MGEEVTLREYLEKVMDERFSSHQALHSAADGVLENRLDRLNELREVVSDIRSGYVTIEKYGADQKLVALVTDRVSGLEGRFLGISFAAMALGAAGVVISLVR